MSSVPEEIDPKGFTFIWILENFSHCEKKRDESLSSPMFVMKDFDMKRFLLNLYPRRRTNEIECELYKTAYSNSYTIDFELSLTTIDGELLYEKKMKNVAFSTNSYTKRLGLFERKKELERLPRDTLIVCCCLWNSYVESSNSVYCYARTQIGMQRKAFVWKIQDFTKLPLKDEKTFCVERVTEESPTTTCTLSLAGTDISSATLQIKIGYRAANSSRRFVTLKISLLDAFGHVAKFMCDENWLDITTVEQTKFFPYFLSRRELVTEETMYLPNDTLSLKCEFTVSDSEITQRIESVTCDRPSGAIAVSASQRNNSFGYSVQGCSSKGHVTQVSNTLQFDLKHLYESNLHTDFNLCSGTETFPVHKSILAARSPIFRAMFKSDMAEVTNSTLDIPDVEAGTLSRMLIFIYTDTLQDLSWQDITKLYFAADKYQLMSLKKKCSSFLASSLQTSNAPDILALADRHHDEELKNAVEDFVFNRGPMAINCPEWKELELQNAPLVLETFRHLFFHKVFGGTEN